MVKFSEKIQVSPKSNTKGIKGEMHVELKRQLFLNSKVGFWKGRGKLFPKLKTEAFFEVCQKKKIRLIPKTSRHLKISVIF